MPWKRSGRPTWTALPVDPEVDPDQRARDASLGLVASLVGVTGAGVVLGGGTPASGAALLASAVAVLAVLAAVRRSPLGLASDLLVRFVVPVAVAAALGRDADGSTTEVVVAWLAAGAAATVAAAEPLLRRVVNRRRMWVHGLPGVPDEPGNPVPPDVARAVALGAVACGVLDAVVDGSSWWFLAAVLVSGLTTTASAAGLLRQVRYTRRLRAGIAKAVRAYAPEFMIYNSRPDDASYQTTMWLPYFKRTGRRFLVVTRAELPAQELAALPELEGVPVLCCRTSRELEDLLCPSLTTVFYPNASSGNGQMVRHSELTHVHIGHGDSDKATSSNPTHAMYDRVFLAGEAAVARYAANGVSIPRTRLQVVGRPQVERIERAERRVSDVAEPTVLYAPTWRGDAAATELYSLPVAEQLVEALLRRGARVVFRPHPYSHHAADDQAVILRVQALLAGDAERTGRRHLWGDAAERDLDVFGCFNISDAMVCDVSSVAVDYLQSAKPMAMYVPAAAQEGFVEQFPVAAGCYLVAPDLSDVDAALDHLLGADPLREHRDRVRIDYLGDFAAQGYSDVFVRAVDQVVSGVGIRHVDVIEGPDAEPGTHDAEAFDAEAFDADAFDADAFDADGDGDRDGVPVVDEGAEQPGDREGAGRDEVAEQRPSRWAQLPLGRLSDQLLDLVSAGAVVMAAVLAFTGGATWLVLLLGGLALLWMCRLRPPWMLPSAGSTLAVFAVQRVLMSAAATGLALRDGSVGDGSAGDGSVVAAGTFVVLTALMCVESWVRPLRSAPRPQVAHLPGVETPAGGGRLHELAYPVWTAVVVLLAVNAALQGSGAVPVVVGALLLVGALVAFVLELAAVRRADLVEESLEQAIARYQPQFVVYFAAASSASYQLAMWTPYFERIGRRFLVVTRTPSTIGRLAELTDAPVVVRPTLRSLDATMAPTLTTVFYVNNGLKNTHYVERRGLTHIWLNHGDSEKPACFNPVHAIYDRIFVAGQAGIDRYARHGVDIPPEKFEIVGRPQVETIEVVPPSWRPPAASGQETTVLYAPTWIGPFADSAVYSLPVGVPVVQALLDRGCRVVFRAHPLNYRSGTGRQLIADVVALLEADAQATGRAHLWGERAEVEMTVQDCFNASDAMIADVSAVVSDYLYSGKPFAIMAMGVTSERLVVEAPVAVSAYVVDGDLTGLDAALDSMLGDDPLADQRRLTRSYYLGDFPSDHYADGFLAAARRHVDRPAADSSEQHALARD